MRDGQHLKIKILIKAYLFCIYCYLFISLLATITSDPHSYFCSASLELLFCFVLLCHYMLHTLLVPLSILFILAYICWRRTSCFAGFIIVDIMIPFTLPSYIQTYIVYLLFLIMLDQLARLLASTG